MKKIEVFDSTLRDGAQGEGISYSIKDKLKIINALCELGVDYIEAGYPSSNPKDVEFFSEIEKIQSGNTKIVAFGSSRRKDVKTEEDGGLLALKKANTKTVAIFGKAWDLHINDVIKTTNDENLRMISDSINYFKVLGKEVIFDSEHFFDGYISNKKYALQTLKTAYQAGADRIILCDTNGGIFPNILEKAIGDAKALLPNAKFGVHCHNDNGLAVYNTMRAVELGIIQVQGTLLGYGERCGNANLSTIIPNLQLKENYKLIPSENMQKLTEISKKVAEISNVKIHRNLPFVGNSAFAHKAGMHADGVLKNTLSFEHINPELVGNERRFLISEIAGKKVLLEKIAKFDSTITKDSKKVQSIINKIKELESQGYQFEGAEGSFELICQKELGNYKPFFKLINYTIMCENPPIEHTSDRATIKIEVDGVTEITVAEGNGPVNALDKALRKALQRFYPSVNSVSLADYKVRVLEGTGATESKVRVLIDSTDGINVWSTVGVSTDIIEASWKALVDGMEYKLIKN